MAKANPSINKSNPIAVIRSFILIAMVFVFWLI
jgi:hypothetical protein